MFSSHLQLCPIKPFLTVVHGLSIYATEQADPYAPNSFIPTCLPVKKSIDFITVALRATIPSHSLAKARNPWKAYAYICTKEREMKCEAAYVHKGKNYFVLIEEGRI